MKFSARLRRSTVRAATCAALLALTGGLPPAVAHADSGKHYYIEIGGTGGSEPVPTCTHSYGFANQALAGNPDNVVVPVCYEASAGPWQAGSGAIPGIGALSYDDSERQGYDNLLAKVESVHKADPDARYTIVGYSQGAQAADQVLQAIAEKRTDIPTSRVEGKLYADPRQPDTGLWSRVPRGWSAFGFTSTGPGPVDFAGIPVARYCIHSDLACDATSLFSVPGLLSQHPRYLREGGILFDTLAKDGQNGIFWYAPNS
ncbi:cutinase family protein [Streptomyces albospinus]|uniref:cutinase family protein n=1 Tax=Streptomyces albospinus TaxID=285515 RepID=UPI001670CF95|nr:PE-PPE domain-containing protein [Streptomyces albospinus]